MKPNIILVTIDSLRSDYLYSDIAETPALDRLMESSSVYSNAFSQGPFTTFSMPSLFTSRYPSGLDYIEFSDSTMGVYIDEKPTFTEVLNDAGYSTAGFHSNPLLSNLFGFDKGFDEFDSSLPFSNTGFLPGRAKILTDKILRIVRKYPYVPAEKINERVVRWIGQESSDPFFTWLHYMDVHGPYQAKSGNTYVNKFRGERLWRKAVKDPDNITENEHEKLKELYIEEVEYVDKCLGDFFDELRNQGVFEDSIIIVTSDHGEQFNEHGNYSHPHELYEELIHIPLIIKDQGTDNNERNISELVGLLDVAPTILGYAGIDSPKSFMGSSLTQRKKFDSDDEEPQYIISEADLVPDYKASVRTPKWKYIHDSKCDSELYNLELDPSEEKNLIDEEEHMKEKLQEILMNHISVEERVVGEEKKVSEHEFDDEGVETRLKDLGYLE